MAFTRNGSTREDYYVSQCIQRKLQERYMDAAPHMPDEKESGGLVVPRFGVYSVANVPRDYMARNAVDVESHLRGIRANDFVRADGGSSSAVTPNTRSGVRGAEFFERPAPFVELGGATDRFAVSAVPCVDPRYQEAERPPFY